MSSATFLLNCDLHGADSIQSLTVRVDRGAKVHEFKTILKGMCPDNFAGLDACCLDLWRWNKPGGTAAVDLDDEDILDPMRTINDVFASKAPRAKWTHIIIKGPEPGK